MVAGHEFSRIEAIDDGRVTAPRGLTGGHGRGRLRWGPWLDPPGWPSSAHRTVWSSFINRLETRLGGLYEEDADVAGGRCGRRRRAGGGCRHDRQLRRDRRQGLGRADPGGGRAADRRGQPAGAGLLERRYAGSDQGRLRILPGGRDRASRRARQGGGRQRRLGRPGRRPDQELRLCDVADLDYRRAQEGGRFLDALLRLRHRHPGQEGHEGRRRHDEVAAHRRAAGDHRGRLRRPATEALDAGQGVSRHALDVHRAAGRPDRRRDDRHRHHSAAGGRLRRAVRGRRPVHHRRELRRPLSQGLGQRGGAQQGDRGDDRRRDDQGAVDQVSRRRPPRARATSAGARPRRPRMR